MAGFEVITEVLTNNVSGTPELKRPSPTERAFLTRMSSASSIFEASLCLGFERPRRTAPHRPRDRAADSAGTDDLMLLVPEVLTALDIMKAGDVVRIRYGIQPSGHDATRPLKKSHSSLRLYKRGSSGPLGSEPSSRFTLRSRFGRVPKRIQKRRPAIQWPAEVSKHPVQG
jgi:hypothetical protein